LEEINSVQLNTLYTGRCDDVNIKYWKCRGHSHHHLNVTTTAVSTSYIILIVIVTNSSSSTTTTTTQLS